MKTKAIKAGFAVSALALAVSPTMATDLRIDGFASFVAGQVLDQDELDATGTYNGYDNRVNFQQDSVYAIQFRGDLKEDLAITAQVIANGANNYDAEVAWAYATYQVSNELSLKVGRSRIPFFMFSDFLDVGYAYTWIKPPVSVYGDTGNFKNLDGVNIEYTTEVAGWFSRLSLMGGRSEAPIEVPEIGESDTSVKNMLIGAWSVNRDWFAMRVSHAQADLTFSAFDEMIDLLTQPPSLGGLGIALNTEEINQLSVDSDRASFSGVGFTIDHGNWIAAAEYTELEFDDSPIVSDTISWYVSLGYRWNKFTYYVVYSEDEDKTNEETTNIVDTKVMPVLASLPPEAAAPINGALNSLYYVETESNSYSIGLRYDFHSAAALKTEYYTTDDDITGMNPSMIRMSIDLVY
ncbi:MAG: porin [Gammaproteobacteria bacterium]|jgi:hypothetical protein|nr:porin [Gammaproteobacteria bacterium]